MLSIAMHDTYPFDTTQLQLQAPRQPQMRAYRQERGRDSRGLVLQQNLN